MYFNDVNFNNYFKILEIRRDILPNISVSKINVTGKDGAIIPSESIFGERYIEVDIEFKGTDREDKRLVARDIASKLFTKKESKLIFEDEPDKHYLARLEGNTGISDIFVFGVSTLTFVCSDPLAYGEKRILDITANPTIYNTATYPTKGKITINIVSNVSYIQVTLQNTGEFIYIKDSFIAGDKVVIDFEEEEVYKNDYSIMNKLYLESDFFEIPVGEFKITTNTGNVTLKYVERWL